MLNYSANGPSGYNLTNSLRLRNSASAYLTRTATTAPTDGKKLTLSCWVKRGILTGNYYIMQSGAGVGNDNYSGFYFQSNNTLVVSMYSVTPRVTTQVFRDPSAWYHLVLAYDTTQATASDRAKLYVNGVQITSFTTNGTIPQNTLIAFTKQSQAVYIGTASDEATYFDGYMTEFNLIDGQALTPSSFGNTNSVTGVWQPAKYTGTYGTNGFYLKFADTSAATAAAIGKDSSGNGNNWTPSGISVTAGVTYDAMLDVPTNTSATVGNYAVMNPLWTDGSVVIAQGNLNVSGGNYGGFSTLTIPTSSKFYAEFTVTATQGNQGVGILKAANAYSGVIAQTDMFGSNSVTYYSVNGNKFVLGGGSTAYGSSWGTINDVIGIAVDTINNQITFYKNNTSQGVITGLTSGIEWVFATGNQTSTGGGAWNFGQRPFTYTAPSGFVALNTFNLPSSTIPQGNKYMDATLYTGTGASLAVTNTAGFKPDLVWVKIRSGAGQHVLTDSVRGVSKQVFSSLTNAETTEAGKGVTSFNSNGFTLGDELVVTGSTNVNAATYVGWQWQANQGSTVSNTSGSITSTVSVNATAGFSVVTWAGSGAAGTVGHGLGVTPAMIITKNRTSGSTEWVTWHKSLSGATDTDGAYIYLNLTGAASTTSIFYNGSQISSSVFGLRGNNINVNATSNNYVAYLWSEIAGFSKFGSYTGNGSADGPFVATNFKPKFILIKVSSTVNGWVIYDTMRDTYNYMGSQLYPHLSNAEAISSSYAIDALSNGFKIRTTNGVVNDSGQTFIYACFASNPFKNSNAV